MISARLPDSLRQALELLAPRFPAARLAAEAAELSAAYRVPRAAVIGSPVSAAAYALTRMPATFAALSAAWWELPFTPATVLDLGGGTGAAAWAAASVWPGAPPLCTLVESNPWMRALGESLGAPNAAWRGGDFRNLAGLGAHDLVSFSYSLGELPAREALETIERAWMLAGRALVIVEPGTPRGYDFTLKARELLLRAGAHVAAPCPHHDPCPLAAPDWCHFAVRVERSRVHRVLKGGSLGYEDEKFSYLAATREPPARGLARILRRPWQDSGAIRLQLCAPGGLAVRTVTRREKTLFRAARKSSWGQRWKEPADDSPTD